MKKFDLESMGTEAFELTPVNIFELAEGLKRKQQEQSNKKPASNTKEDKVKTAKLSRCPLCGHLSVYFNETTQKSECLNLSCEGRRKGLFDNVIWPDVSQ